MTTHTTQATHVVNALQRIGAKLAIAESCTGGLLSSAITQVSGASAVFEYGFIAYANAAKVDVLGVPEELITQYGAVSAPVACAMAEGAQHRAHAHYGVAITGIAGPSGGSDEKPVGTVFIALARPYDSTLVERIQFSGDRITVQHSTVAYTLGMLLQAMG